MNINKMDDVVMGSTVKEVSDPLIILRDGGTLGDDDEGHDRSLTVGKESEDVYLEGTINCGKKRHRRKNKGGKHHKKWKPYSKMTWNERQELEEKESKRANQRVEKRFAEGHPVAPYNTTQFLMDDHMTEKESNTEFDQNDDKMSQKRQLSHEGSRESWESSDEFYESPNDEEIFLAKDFSDTYDNIHAERLQNMSKEDLVKEYLEMELKVEKLERKPHNNRDTSPEVISTPCVQSDTQNNYNSDCNGNETIKNLLEEIHRLTNENEQLLAENKDMRAQKDARKYHLPFQKYAI